MILVTGAFGFIGRHLVKTLRERIPGASIRLFDATPPSGALPEGVQALCGLVEDPEPVAAAVNGVEVVIHLAAKVQPDSRELQEMWRVNVEGTQNLYSAAVESGCRLFLHMSSAGVYGPPHSPNPFREDDVPNPVTPYQRTKWQAEEALRHMDSKSTTLNILRPAGIYGSGSHLEIPAYRKILRQRWALELSGGVIVHPTHVRDVVEAILAVLEQPAPHGMVFNIGGEQPLRQQDLQGLVAETLEVPRRRLVLPSGMSGLLAGVAGPLLSFMGRPKPLLERMSRGHLFSAAVNDRCFRQLYPNVPIVALKDGLQEHIKWALINRLL